MPFNVDRRRTLQTQAATRRQLSTRANRGPHNRESPVVLIALLLVAILVFAAACGSPSTAGEGGGNDVASLDEPTATTGSGDATGTENSGGAEEVDAQQAMLDYAKCMREQGIDMPDPEFDDEGNPLPQEFEDETGGEGDMLQGPGGEFEDANEVCAEHLEGMTLNISEKRQQEMEDAMLAFAECMREQGIDMPDPEPISPGVEPAGRPMEFDPSDPNVRAAMDVCEPLMRDAMRFDGGDGSEENQP